MTDKKYNIILIMISFFINEMCENGICNEEEIKIHFNKDDENKFKKMIKEYKYLQSLTRCKAINYAIKLKKEINVLKSDIKIS